MGIKISNTDLSGIIAEIMKGHKISDICISPGSRNTPLIQAFTSDKYFNNYSHIDERISGFFALGQSKITKKPSVIVTTSGTAVANLLPSVIEADLSMTPLIILSSDRPKKLIKTGENQTINQYKIFDNFIRNKIHIESPFQSEDILIKKINSIICIANGANHNKASGPVHINIAFDEPLLDKKTNIKIKIINNKISYIPKKINLPKFKKPIIVCGQLDSTDYYNKIIALSKQFNAPIFADTISQVRLWKKHSNIMCHYDFYIDKIDDNPDIIIRFGKKPTSKKLNNFLKKLKNKIYLVSNHMRYNDDAKNSIHTLDLINNHNADKNWFEYIKKFESKISELLNKYLNDTNFFEGNIIASIIRNCKKKDNLFIGNSLIVRNLEKYCTNTNQKINIFTNRGASGIDGIISTAMGVASKNYNSRNILIIGDVSFYYDLNALILNKNKINLAIIIINNNGGQIFSTLDYKNKIRNFDKFLITKTDIKIKNICKLLSIKYNRLSSIKMIHAKLNSIINKKGIKIIEVKCDITKTLKIEKNIKKER